MPRGTRTYGQYCSVARALEMVGDRWTLLLIRELLISRRRFKDLLEALPGIGTNLLTARLRRLEKEGVVQRTRLGPPAGVLVYELTPHGRGLEPVLLSLARWGLQYLGPRGKLETVRPAWAVLAAKATFRPEQARSLREIYQFLIDSDAFYFTVRDGRVQTALGTAEFADLIVTTNAETFLALASGKLSPKQAIAGAKMRIQGSRRTLKRAIRLFGFPAGAEMSPRDTNGSTRRDGETGKLSRRFC